MFLKMAKLVLLEHFLVNVLKAANFKNRFLEGTPLNF